MKAWSLAVWHDMRQGPCRAHLLQLAQRKLPERWTLKIPPAGPLFWEWYLRGGGVILVDWHMCIIGMHTMVQTPLHRTVTRSVRFLTSCFEWEMHGGGVAVRSAGELC